jgi:hypothetical protein
MTQIRLGTRIACPADAVFAFLTDAGQMSVWLPILQARHEPQDGPRAGSTLLITRNIVGLRRTFVGEVVRHDPRERCYTVRSTLGLLQMEVRWHAVPLGRETRLLLTVEVHLATGRVSEGLLALALTRHLSLALRRIKRVLEGA